MEKIENNEAATFENEDEISLIDLFAVLLRRKWLIIITTAIAMIGVVIVSILSLKLDPEKSFMPNVYTPKAEMLINDGDSSGSSLSSMLSASGLSGIAGLAGVNVNAGSSNSSLASYLLYSNTIMDSVINKFNFIEEWKIEKSPITSSREQLKKVLKSDFDSDTGIFTVSFTDKNPDLARNVVNYVVDMLEQRFLEIGVDQNKLAKQNLEENIQNAYDNILNLQKQIADLENSVSAYGSTDVPSIVLSTSLLKMELSVQEQIYSSLKAQYESLKVTMASEQPVFQILEYAEIPDRKSGPSRGKLCIIVTFAAFFVSVFLAFLLNALENIKKDPEAMAKLKGTKK